MQRSSIPDCRQMCMEALTEAEACGDAEMQAELFMQGALLDLQDGRDVKDIKETLQVRASISLMFFPSLKATLQTGLIVSDLSIN